MKTDSIGLALSGGGSKGIAHAGVLQFLDEKNIKPTHISGTSAGAIVGALYSWGKSPKEILDFFKSIYFFNWSHFTFRKPAIIDSDSFKNYFKVIFGDAILSDLSIINYITATDMIKGELKIFDHNTKIVDAILASSAVPGVLSPYQINNELYSDGGILNHFPTDILRNICDLLIGVYVSPIQKVEAKDLNSIKAITSRAFDLLSSSDNVRKFDICDWIIAPQELTSFSTFETSKIRMDTIFNIGYNIAKKDFERSRVLFYKKYS